MPVLPTDTASWVKWVKEDPKGLISWLESQCELGEIQAIHHAFPDRTAPEPDAILPNRYDWTPPAHPVDVLSRYLGRIYMVAGSPLYGREGPLSVYRICGNVIILRDQNREEWLFDRPSKHWTAVPEILRRDWPVPAHNLLAVNMELIKTGASSATTTTAMAWRRFSQCSGGERFPLMSLSNATRFKIVEHLVRDPLFPHIADIYDHGDRSDVKPEVLVVLKYQGVGSAREQTAMAVQWGTGVQRAISFMMVTATASIKKISRTGHTLLDAKAGDGRRHVFVVEGVVPP